MRALFVTVLLCGCATKDAPHDKPASSRERSATAGVTASSRGASASASATAPPSFDKLSVTVDGAPVKIQQALIKRIPLAGRYQLLLNDAVTQCDQLVDNLFDGKSLGPNHLLLDVGQHLSADGTLTPVVTYSYASGSSEQQKGTKVKIGGKADKGENVEISLDMTEIVDKKTGKRVGAVPTPRLGQYGLMTYMHQGKQYVVMPIQGGYTTLALP